VDLVAERLGQALIAGVNRGRDGGVLAQQVLDALGFDGGLVVHAARAHRPGPKGPAVPVGDGGGLDGVLLLLAGDERPPPRPVGPWPADLGLGPVQAQLDPFGRCIGEHIRKLRRRRPGWPGTANPRAASNGRISWIARVMVARSTPDSTARA
jgi:hypothetical protein